MDWCSDSKLLIQRPVVASSTNVSDYGLVAPGGGIRVDLCPFGTVDFDLLALDRNYVKSHTEKLIVMAE